MVDKDWQPVKTLETAFKCKYPYAPGPSFSSPVLGPKEVRAIFPPAAETHDRLGMLSAIGQDNEPHVEESLAKEYIADVTFCPQNSV